MCSYCPGSPIQGGETEIASPVDLQHLTCWSVTSLSTTPPIFIFNESDQLHIYQDNLHLSWTQRSQHWYIWNTTGHRPPARETSLHHFPLLWPRSTPGAHNLPHFISTSRAINNNILPNPQITCCTYRLFFHESKISIPRCLCITVLKIMETKHNQFWL